MPARKRSDGELSASRRRPATTPEGREAQLIALAMDVAERQLLDGTASAQVVSQLLKMGSPRERLERERLDNENVLLKAKAETIASQARIEELYSTAIKAMRQYGGQDTENEGEYDR